MINGITASLAQAARKIVEDSRAKAAEESAINISKLQEKMMKPAHSGTAPRNDQERKLAAMTPPADKITQGDVLKGRGVKKEEIFNEAKANYDKLSLAQLHAKHAKHYDSNERNFPKSGGDGSEFESEQDDSVNDRHEKAAKAIELHVHKKYGGGEKRKMIRHSKDKMIKRFYAMYGGKKQFDEWFDIDKFVENYLNESYLHSPILEKANYDKLSLAQLHAKHAKHFDSNERNFPKSGGDGSEFESEQDDEINDKHEKAAKNIEHHVQRKYGSGEMRKMIRHSKDKMIKRFYAMHGGKKQFEEWFDIEKSVEKYLNEAPMDGVAPGSMEGDKHMCATKVFHKEWKEGKPLFSQHADPDAEGNIAWYDVMFEHGIEKEVAITELQVLAQESHMHSKKKKM